MVHFGEYLHRHRVSEWQSEYVHYTLLRRQIRDIQQALMVATPHYAPSRTACPGSGIASHDAAYSNDSVEPVAATRDDALLSLGRRQLDRSAHTVVDLDPDSDDDNVDASETGQQPGDECHECRHPDLNDKLEKHRRQYHQHGQQASPASPADFRHYDVEHLHDYPALSSLLPADTPALQQEQCCFDILDLELHNVNSCFMSQQHYLDEHYELLSRQVTALLSPEQQHKSSHDKRYHELDRALRELYRGLLMVRTYREANYTTVLKVLAQHDRVSTFNAAAACLPYIHSMYAFRSPILDEARLSTPTPRSCRRMTGQQRCNVYVHHTSTSRRSSTC